MKIIFIYIIIASGLFTLVSCNKSDEFDGTIEVFEPPVFSDATPVDSKIKEMHNIYNVIFKPKFTPAEYSYNWDKPVTQTEATIAGQRYTPAKDAYVIPVIDSVASWVFKVFPLEFSKKYMPFNILLTDTLEMKWSSGTTIVHRIYEGFIANNYIAVPYVSERFDTQKTKRLLRESWLSLFVEKMLIRLPAPASSFTALSATGYAKLSFTNAEDVALSYGILKKSRLKQNSSAATAAWYVTTPVQDFGDFVAFIVYTPEAEKQTVYAKNAAILTKVNIVKDYFKTNFNIDLPYIPTQP